MSIKTPYPAEDEPRLELRPDDKLENHIVVLVTGANSYVPPRTISNAHKLIAFLENDTVASATQPASA